MDGHSALCQQVLSQVVRNPAGASNNPEGITSVLVLPINAAIDRTSGVDLSTHYLLETQRAGSFDFNLGLTYVATHKVQLFKGGPNVNEFTDMYDYVIPRSKASYSAAWTMGRFTTTLHGSRLDGLPNYTGTQRLGPTFLYNGSLNYRITPRTALTVVVDNLLDTRPKRDSTWTSYPYYYRSWFSPVGRAYFVEFNVRFGGAAG